MPQKNKGEHRCIAPCFLKPGTTQKWAVCCTSWPLHCQARSPWYPFNKSLGRTLSQSRHLAEKKNLLYLPHVKWWFPSCPVCCLVTTLTMLLKLTGTCSRSWIDVCVAQNIHFPTGTGIFSSYKTTPRHFFIVSFNKKNLVIIVWVLCRCWRIHKSMCTEGCLMTLATDTKNHCPVSHMHMCLPSVIRCTNTFCYHDVMSLVFMCTLHMTRQPTFLKTNTGLWDHYTVSTCPLFNFRTAD
jgi:hypothetical protein